MSPRQQERWIKAIIYGEYGCGKTHFAGTAVQTEKGRDVLYIDAESGALTLSRPEFADIDVVRINKFAQLARVHEFLKVHVAARDENNEERLLELDQRLRGDGVPKLRRYKTVVIDSLTEVHKYCMYQIQGINIGTEKFDSEPTAPGYEGWGKSTEMIRLLVRTFRDLPMHVIFLMSEKHTEDTAKRARVSVNLPKALSQELPGFVDVVGYLQASSGDQAGTQRRLSLEPGRTFLAKCRLPNVSPYIDEPTVGKLLGLIK